VLAGDAYTHSRWRKRELPLQETALLACDTTFFIEAGWVPSLAKLMDTSIRLMLYRPRLLRHQVEAYAARAAD
jgi:hypothetical protein